MRRLTRIVFFLLVVSVAFFPTPAQVRLPVFRTEPLLATVSLLSQPFSWGLAGGIVVLALSLRFPRFYCRFLCPLGTLLTFLRRGSTPCRRCLRSRPLPSRWRWVGRFVLALLFLSLLSGKVGFLWLDPMALFLSFLGIRGFGAVSFLAITILLLSVVVPNLWCGILCPCGALSDLLHIPRRIVTGRTGHRKIFAPSNPSESSPLPSSESVATTTPTVPPPRRRFLRGVGGIVGFLLGGGGSFALMKRVPATPRFIRPPGALGEESFLTLCARCGECRRLCPTGLLKRVDRGGLSLETPVADFETGWCPPDCDRCAESCPTGALRLFTPEDKIAHPMAVIQLAPESCRLWDDRECFLCRNECPTGAISYVWDDDEYLTLPSIDVSRCNGCGRCVFVCPGLSGSKALLASPPDR